MAKLTLEDLANLNNPTSAVASINANNAAIEAALENTLSRDGTSPNVMNADLDMNDFNIINAGGLSAAGNRVVLTADRTYYVRSDGSNSNTGLANTAGGAFLTLQYANDVVAQTIDLAGHRVTIQIGLAGTYVGVNIGQYQGGGGVYYLGDPANPNSYIITPAPSAFFLQACIMLHLYTNTVVSLNGLRLAGGTGINCIENANNTIVVLGDDLLGGGHMVLVPGTNSNIVSGTLDDICTTTVIDATGGITCAVVFEVDSGEMLALFSAYTILGTLTVTTAFINAPGGYASSVSSFTGTVIGPRYHVSLNGVLNTGGAGSTYFPGNSSGASATGGQYV